MPFPVSELNTMLDSVTVTHAAAFNGDPQGGGSQVGDRAPVTLGAASGGVRQVTGSAPEVAVPAGATVNHWAYYDGATGGTLRFSESVEEETWAEGGEGGVARLVSGSITLENA